MHGGPTCAVSDPRLGEKVNVTVLKDSASWLVRLCFVVTMLSLLNNGNRIEAFLSSLIGRCLNTILSLKGLWW